MTAKPETLTCHQLWKRYYRYSEKRKVFHTKWKHFVDELHDIEIRIDIVKDAIRKENEKILVGGPKTQRFIFLRNELSKLTDLRKETHALIIFYKKRCEIVTTQSNRYKMAYCCLKSINSGDEFRCDVITYKNGGLNISFDKDGTGEITKFRF